MPKNRYQKPSSQRPAGPRPLPAPIYRCEAAVAAGLEDIARNELLYRLGRYVHIPQSATDQAEAGAVPFDYTGDLRALLHLRSVIAVFLVRQFPVPRPRALLGDEHFRALLQQIATARELHPPTAYQSLYLGAAGADSAVMTRLKHELAQHMGLRVEATEGDLLLRLRPASTGAAWESLVRLSPRPLATRPWRVCNMEGALNASVAHAMAMLTHPLPSDVFLNLACGSGTLLIERIAAGPFQRAIGCDSSPVALECARSNLKASGFKAELFDWDVRKLPLPDHSIDTFCADLPFGNLMGSHAENLTLYPALLAEAARVARPGATFVLITHEVRLMEQLLGQSADWSLTEVRRIVLGGLHPRIFVLQRR